jgi:hypothetical protein
MTKITFSGSNPCALTEQDKIAMMDVIRKEAAKWKKNYGNRVICFIRYRQ